MCLLPEANAIGPVNTVIPFTNASGHRGLFGDNMDWIGIRNVIKALLLLSLNNVESCLVIGAGGTTRAAISALHALGASRIYLFNCTRRSAEEPVHVVPDAQANVELDTLDVASVQGPLPSVIISNVPAFATMTTEEHVLDALFLPSSIFSADGSVAVYMAYKPTETLPLGLAKAVTGGKGHCVMGIEVLLEQGYRQFELGREGIGLGAWCPRRLWWPAKRLRRLGLSFFPGSSWLWPITKKKRNDELK